MKKKLTLLILALFMTIGGAWADTYTITYNKGAGGTFSAANASGWCSSWVSTDTPTITFLSASNGFNTNNGALAQQSFTISVQDGYIITGYKISCVSGWGALVTTASNETETFSGAKEKTFSVEANATSTSFSVSNKNLNNATINI